MRLRIATFNVENLMSRNRHGPRERPRAAPAMSLFDFADPALREHSQAATAIALEDEDRRATALAIAETQADLLLLQEVDNLGVLAPFLANYVHPIADCRYGHMRLIAGNDPRGIDVAFCARKGLFASEKDVVATSYHEATFGELGVHGPDLEALGIGPDSLVFNRDCLEIELKLPATSLTLFICHMKSFGYGADARERTRPLRHAEARAVRRIVENRFGEGWREANWIIAGDLNDYRARILPGGLVEDCRPSGLDPLLDDFAVDICAGLPESERWSVHHRDVPDDGSAIVDQHVQLDYILVSPAIARANPRPNPLFIRRGLPYRTPLDPAAPDRSIAYLATRADRYPGIGYDRPRASDHCPLAVTLDLPDKTGQP